MVDTSTISQIFIPNTLVLIICLQPPEVGQCLFINKIHISNFLKFRIKMRKPTKPIIQSFLMHVTLNMKWHGARVKGSLDSSPHNKIHYFR